MQWGQASLATRCVLYNRTHGFPLDGWPAGCSHNPPPVATPLESIWAAPQRMQPNAPRLLASLAGAPALPSPTLGKPPWSSMAWCSLLMVQALPAIWNL